MGKQTCECQSKWKAKLNPDRLKIMKLICIFPIILIFFSSCNGDVKNSGWVTIENEEDGIVLVKNEGGNSQVVSLFDSGSILIQFGDNDRIGVTFEGGKYKAYVINKGGGVIHSNQNSKREDLGENIAVADTDGDLFLDTLIEGHRRFVLVDLPQETKRGGVKILEFKSTGNEGE